MTYREFLDKCYNTIYSLQDMYLVCSNNVQYDQLESSNAEEKMKLFYYFLKIEKRYDDGTIETETGDDFPFHSIPYKPYNYPEQALIYQALEQEGMIDKEVDEVFIGTYDWNIDTYVM